MSSGWASAAWMRGALLVAIVAAGSSARIGVCSSATGTGLLQQGVPLQRIVDDLEVLVPRRLDEANVPGLSLALIRDGRVVWERGFGVANRWTGEPITPRTVMQVGSIGKAVGAYGALRLADRGIIDLDEPLDRYLGHPWLSDPEGRRRITMRMVLTHTSGLSNNVMWSDRHLLFPPGERYSYSGQGFVYLQQVLEVLEGRPISAIMEDEVFRPLSMTTASYDPEPDGAGHLASGHVPFEQIIFLVLVPAAVLVSVVAGVGLVVNRMLYKRWRLGRRGRWIAGVAGPFITLAALVAVLGAAYMLVAGVAASAFLACVTAVSVGGIWMVRRCSGGGRYVRPVWTVVAAIWVVAVTLVVGWASASVLVPVPGAPTRSGSLAWSLHASTEDLASFVLAIMAASGNQSSLVHLMTVPQVEVSDGTAWGMGIGLREGEEGRAFFHTGVNPGFESLLVGFPGSGAGLVVLTNGSGGLRVAQQIAVRVFGPSLADLDDAAPSGGARE